MKFKVDFTPQALEDISRLDKVISGRVIKRVEWLSENIEIINPQALKGRFQGMFKLVVGDWRVIYTANFTNRLITIHLVGHRKEIYKI